MICMDSPSNNRNRNKKNIAFNEVDEHGNPIVVGSLQLELDALMEKYRFLHKAPRVMNLEKIDKTVKTKYRKHAFPLPQQLVGTIHYNITFLCDILSFLDIIAETFVISCFSFFSTGLPIN